MNSIQEVGGVRGWVMAGRMAAQGGVGLQTLEGKIWKSGGERRALVKEVHIYIHVSLLGGSKGCKCGKGKWKRGASVESRRRTKLKRHVK